MLAYILLLLCNILACLAKNLPAINSFTDTEMSDISEDFSPLKLTDYFQK